MLKKICLILCSLSLFAVSAPNFAATETQNNITHTAGKALSPFDVALRHYQGDGVKRNYKEAFSWCERGMAMDDPNSYYLAGIMLFNGQGVEKDRTRATTYFLTAAEKGNRAAQSAIGISYLYGRGIKQNIEKGIKWLEKSAAQGLLRAHNELAFLYTEGELVPKDPAKAFIHNLALAKSEKKDSPWVSDAPFKVGSAYLMGKGTEQNDTEAFKWLRIAAEEGNPEAIFLVANFYRRGGPVEANRETYLEWLTLSAKKGWFIAQENLGNELFNEKRYTEAIPWLAMAAERGSGKASAFLADIYATGKGVKVNPEKAFKWILSAAEKGSAEHMLLAADCYYEGWGTETNDGKAYDWALKAADEKLPEAYHLLGRMYFHRRVPDQSARPAVGWLEKASEAGIADAEYLLGKMYRDGIGVYESPSIAKHWFSLACDHGIGNACEEHAALHAVSDSGFSYAKARAGQTIDDILITVRNASWVQLSVFGLLIFGSLGYLLHRLSKKVDFLKSEDRLVNDPKLLTVIGVAVPAALLLYDWITAESLARLVPYAIGGFSFVAAAGPLYNLYLGKKLPDALVLLAQRTVFTLIVLIVLTVFFGILMVIIGVMLFISLLCMTLAGNRNAALNEGRYGDALACQKAIDFLKK